MRQKIDIIDDISSINRKEWNAFISEHPKGSIFQTPEMYDCYYAFKGQNPSAIFALSNGKIVGVLVAVEMHEDGFIKKFFSTRSIILSGPIVKNDDQTILSFLLQHYKKNIHPSVIYTQIRNQFDQLKNCDIFRQNGFKFESHLNYLVKTDDENAIWSRIGKGRVKQIKKAIKKGLTVKAYKASEIDGKLLSSSFDVIQDVYNRANLPLASFSLIEEAWHKQIIVLFVVKTEDGKIVGCRFALSYKAMLYGWYAGSYTQYYNLFPNDLLIWETLRWACNNGYKYFDYGGAGSPNKAYGVRDFKSQIGGDLVNFGRYEFVHHKMRMLIAKLGYSIYRLLFSF